MTSYWFNFAGALCTAFATGSTLADDKFIWATITGTLCVMNIVLAFHWLNVSARRAQ